MNSPLLSTGLKGKLRISLLCMVAPFFLAACLFEEVSEEHTEVVFEDSGTVRYSLQVEGTLDRDLHDMPEIERVEEIAEWAKLFSESGLQSFSEGYLGSSISPRGATEAIARLEGRFLSDASSVDEQLPPLHIQRIGLHAWEIRIRVTEVRDYPTTLCITLESGWAVLQQPAQLPAVTPGRENCVDLRQLHDTRMNDSLQIIRVNPDGSPADGRPDAEIAREDMRAWFEERAPFLRVLHMNVPVADRPDGPAYTEVYNFSANVSANEQLYALVEEIDEIRILSEAAHPRLTMTIRGSVVWELGYEGWHISRVRLDNSDEVRAFGYSRSQYERNGVRTVLDDTLEAEMLRATLTDE